MLNLNAGEFMRLMQLLFDSEKVLGRFTTDPLIKDFIQTNASMADSLKEYATKLNLPVTAHSTEYIRVSKTGEDLVDAIRHMKRNFHAELQSKTFFSTEPKYVIYYNNSKIFGEEVFNSFPSAAEDIYEAGMCLSLERGTACVMHLNRALECGLSALAKAVDIPKQNDWGGYIRKISNELDARAKTAGARSADEQFYAEAAANFDRLRRAYRNPTMHPEKTYSQERAEEILLSTKAFMSHLASRVSE